MSYRLHGRLCGYICDECPEPLVGSVVQLYSAAKDSLVGRVAADPKDTLRLLTPEEAGSRRATLLAEATIGDDGSFQADLPEIYEGGPLDIDVVTATAPGMKARKEPPAPVQVHVTTDQPRWQQTEAGQVAVFEYCLPSRVWCLIRGTLGAWTICGTVTVCDTKQPIAGVTVRAFDTDWIQDDDLGSGVTDPAGHFRIDYTTSAFDRTPFSPVINVECVSGPDLYFRVEGPGATPLLVEPRSKGRTPGRENVGPCTCVDLCLTGDVPPGTIPTIPMFTKVGDYRVDPLFAHFAPDGTTAVGNLAFTSDLHLIGIMPDPLSPDSIEYRFTVENLAGGGPQPVDATQMAPTVIGELQFFAWDAALSPPAWVPRSADFFANNPGATVSIPQDAGLPDRVVSVNTAVKAGGWIEAPRTNNLVPRGDGRFIPHERLADLRTANYTSETFDLKVPAPGLQAGDSVPAGSRSLKPTFQIVFEARKVGPGPSVGTNTLDNIAFSNVTYSYVRHPYWAGGPVSTTGVASLGVEEMVIGGGCAELGDTLHALFTAYHPYVGQPKVYFEGNPVLPADIFPPVVSDEVVSVAGGNAVDITLLAKCAYILWLEVPLRLTYGYGSLGWVLYDRIGFCKK